MASKIFWVALIQVIFVASLSTAQTHTMKKGQLMAAIHCSSTAWPHSISAHRSISSSPASAIGKQH
jgi:hypothetical protein